MTTKTKAFDCVEMKRRAQEKLMAEYEARKGEFDSYSQFIDAKSAASAWQQSFWSEVDRAGGKRE